jgi:hypothetical protein
MVVLLAGGGTLPLLNEAHPFSAKGSSNRTSRAKRIGFLPKVIANDSYLRVVSLPSNLPHQDDRAVAFDGGTLVEDRR